MKKATLHIETRDQSISVPVEDEVTIGRTDSSQIVLDDTGLSRVNTTFFRDGDQLLVVDENSLNGTHLNGQKLGGKPVGVLDGDTLKLGLETQIRVEIESEVEASAEQKPPAEKKPEKPKPAGSVPKPKIQNRKSTKPPPILIASALLTFLIILGAGFTLLLIWLNKEPGSGEDTILTSQTASAAIPVRVIDPLGGGDAEDWDDILSFWDAKEADINVADVDAVTASEAEGKKTDLIVSIELYKAQLDRANQARPNSGINPPGMIIPPELRNGIGAQIRKIQEMKRNNYKLPLDFADLAEKRLGRKLIELPMATADFVLDVGGSSTPAPFTDFQYDRSPQSIPVPPGSADFQILSQTASNFDGQKYDLNLERDRKQIKIRLLRMFHPAARPILETLARNYRAKFSVPLKITSLSRSMEYQIALNKGNANSYVVRSADAVPPHTSGCAFDLSRSRMSATEQNYLMGELAKLEQQNAVDALIEFGTNACFHVFILSGCEA